MSFFKSEIMRSYYRTAKDNGWVEKEPEVIKVASKNNLNPSKDLFVDMCRLAEALREKGYVKHADDLEKKISLYKSAEIHLYKVHEEDGPDLLEFAHPEGDQSIGESSNDYGTVETLLSSHKKMKDIVNKQPTGKLASLATQIVKSAQSIEKKDILENINLNKKKALVAIGNPSRYVFSFEKLSNGYAIGGNDYTRYFEKFAKDSIVSSIGLFSNYLNSAYQNPRNFSPESIAARIRSSLSSHVLGNPEKGDDWHKELISFVNNIETGKFNQWINNNYPQNFFSGSNMIFTGKGDDNIRLNQLSNIIHDRALSLKNQIQQEINRVNLELQKEVSTFLNGLNNVEIVSNAEVMKKRFYPYFGTKAMMYVQNLMRAFDYDFASYQEAVFEIWSLIDKLGSVSNKISGLAQVVSTRFSKSANIYNELSRKSNIEGLRANAEKSEALAENIVGYDGNFENLMRKISPLLPGVSFKDFSELDGFSQRWLIAARKNKDEIEGNLEAVSLEDLPD